MQLAYTDKSPYLCTQKINKDNKIWYQLYENV